jgi:hypothetical protein
LRLSGAYLATVQRLEKVLVLIEIDLAGPILRRVAFHLCGRRCLRNRRKKWRTTDLRYKHEYWFGDCLATAQQMGQLSNLFRDVLVQQVDQLHTNLVQLRFYRVPIGEGETTCDEFIGSITIWFSR